MIRSKADVVESQEVELKLELPPGEIEALRHAPVLGDPARRPVDQVTTYFDTAKGELRKAGYSLRLRRKGRSFLQTVKHRGADSGGFSSRAEWEKKLDSAELDFEALKATPVGKLLSKRDMQKRLRPVSETKVRRTTWLVERDSSQVELILDEGKVTAGGAEAGICEVELELKRGSRSELFAMAQELGGGLTLRMGVVSKSERGFRLLEGRTRRVQKAEKIRIRDTMSNAEAFSAIVQSCLRHFRLNEPLIEHDMNALALHQARVAMRRLRSALTLFRPAVSDGDFSPLRNQLRWFTDKLGEARNLDVLLEATPAEGTAPDPAIRKQLRRSRKDAYRKVQAALAEPRLPQLILALVAWSETGGWRESDLAREPVRRFAGERLERSWKRVRKQGKQLRLLTPDERHVLRIEIKRLRYAAEFFAGLSPKARRAQQKDFVAACQELQELLGDLNDLETRRQLAPQLLSSEQDYEEEVARLLEATERVYSSLRAVGPYWR